MKHNQILITITDLGIIDDLKKLGISKYVFPLKGFCVGIPNTFYIDEINEKGYIYINRILDNDSIEKLKNIKEEITANENIIGIIFDDLGIINIFKDTSLEKILYMTHFLSSTMEVNAYLEYVDSLILSTDITLEEIKKITRNSNKEVSIFTFGLVSCMYSRRKLISNYCDFHKLPFKNPLNISIDNSNFKLYEEDEGTIIYYDKYLYDEHLFEVEAKYYFFYPLFLDNKEIIELLKGNLANIPISNHFLYKNTIYKIKGGEIDA